MARAKRGKAASFLCRMFAIVAILLTGESLTSSAKGSFVLRASARLTSDDSYNTFFPSARIYSSPEQFYPQSVAGSESDWKRTTALKLAKARMNDAQIYLAEVADSAVLVGDCPKQLDAVETGLNQAAKYIGEEGRENDSAQELDAAEAALDDCIDAMTKIKSNEGREVRASLRKVGRYVSSAQKFLDISSPGKDEEDSADNTSPEASSKDTVSGNTDVAPKAVPLGNLMVDYCPNHVTLSTSTATIRLDKACGGKFHSQDKYSSGVFTALMRTPVKATGVSNSFFISSNDQASDTISFDFLGNHPNRIITNYAVNGNSAGNQQVIVVSFDTSVKFHRYTIKWDATSIVWIVDSTLLRVVTKADAGTSYPAKPGSVYGYTWDASTVANGGYAGTVDWSNAPFSMYFDSLSVISPLATGAWQPPPPAIATSDVPVPMRPLAIDYCASNVAVALSDISITYDATGCGGRFRSLHRYPSGKFSGSVKCASADTSGLLSSLYLSSLEGSRTQDEMDFEWLGNDKSVVQTNFYVDGVGGHEAIVDLGFDCSQAFHTYTILYDSQQIQWLVDNKVVRTVTPADKAGVYPSKPVYCYASVWNASGVNNGGWTGKWHGRDLPYVVQYSDVTIQGRALPFEQ